MIHFKYVRWRNFLSTGNQFTEIQLDRSSTTLIIGENGAGKSTILDALFFGLFGKPFRNINKPQLLNSVNGGNCEVEVEFRIGKKEVKVVRGIKPNKFEIYINGKMYNQDANVRDYQKYLEQQILKLNYRSFTQVVILGSSTFIPFMQLKARHRREVVEEILDIQIFSLMNMLVKQRMKTIAEDMREMDYNVKLNQEKITLQEKYISEVKQNKEKLVEEKTSLISSNEEEVFSRNAENTKLKEEKDKWLSDIVDKDRVVTTINKLNNLKSTLREKKNSNAKMLKFFEDNDDCPTCEQPLNNSEEMIALKEKEVEKFSTALDELDDKITETKDRQTIIKDTIEKVRENEVQIAKNGQFIVQLEKFNSTLTAEIAQLADEELSKSDYDKLKRLKKKISCERKRFTMKQ